MKAVRNGIALALVLGLAGCGASTDARFGWYGRKHAPAEMGQGGTWIRWTQRLTQQEFIDDFTPIERAAAALDPKADRIYIGSSGGKLYALDSSGRRVYRFDAGADIQCAPVLDEANGELVLGTEQGGVFVLRASDGKKRLAASAPGPVRATPVVDDARIYVVTGTDQVVAFSRKDGSEVWRYTREAPEGFTISEHAGLTLHEGRLYTAFTDGTVVAFNPATGGVHWERPTADDLPAQSDDGPKFKDVDTTPLVRDGVVFVAGFSAGLYALDAGNGTVLRRLPDMTGIVGITALGDDLLLASADEGLVRFRPTTEKVVWRKPFKRGAPGVPVVLKDKVVVGESKGSLLVLEGATGVETDRLGHGPGFEAPVAVADGLAFALANDGTLFSFGVR